MIEHAMKYVQLAEKTRKDLARKTSSSDDTYGQYLVTVAELFTAEDALIEAEKQMVAAYGQWREAMKKAEALGSHRAQVYLQRTLWDLT